MTDLPGSRKGGTPEDRFEEFARANERGHQDVEAKINGLEHELALPESRKSSRPALHDMFSAWVMYANKLEAENERLRDLLEKTDAYLETNTAAGSPLFLIEALASISKEGRNVSDH